ncbi:MULTISPECIES: hypothetical protein [Corynebacterium]|uniref:hypothetical protein n=1 Tax=Corynebacterium TaxID=1716 RepID=UPI001A320ED6|nr:hypothetical protein [uncultured Tessaracoccus sp.]HAT1172117.1 hypothetical protein [Corynebacterium striatum]HAT1177248.1 hypothetical protein [Corynebacterium striatum]HAT1329460.1 hypothetical protein [Corynebacterium striatum]HAT1331944.1 hypothetical protein [Corynebacterium striatum]HAT1339315.1 hypothetical protein [Corynebacterium striatum]
MSDGQIVPAEPSLPPTAMVLNQLGANGVQIAHAGTVNAPIQIVVPTPVAAVGVPAIQVALSSDYYQLIVTPDFDPNTRSVPMDPKRALTESMCPTNREQLKKLDKDAIEMLKTYPALIMNENDDFGRASEEQVAYFAAVTNIRNGVRGIKIEYTPLTEIPQQRINELLEELDLSGNDKFNELNRTHWAVKNVDLVHELAQAGISVLMPTLIGGQP